MTQHEEQSSPPARREEPTPCAWCGRPENEHILAGNPAQVPVLESFDSHSDSVRLQRALSQMRAAWDCLQKLLPSTFYADRDLRTRVEFLVDAWKWGIETIAALEQERDALRASQAPETIHFIPARRGRGAGTMIYFDQYARAYKSFSDWLNQAAALKAQFDAAGAEIPAPLRRLMLLDDIPDEPPAPERATDEQLDALVDIVRKA